MKRNYYGIVLSVSLCDGSRDDLRIRETIPLFILTSRHVLPGFIKFHIIDGEVIEDNYRARCRYNLEITPCRNERA